MAVTANTPTTSSAALLADLQRIVGHAWVLSDPDDLLLYEYDGSVDRALPDALVYPDTTAQVQAVVQARPHHAVPVVARCPGAHLSR